MNQRRFITVWSFVLLPGLTILFILIASQPLSAQDTVAQLEPVRTFEGGGLWVTDVSFSQHGSYLAASYNGANIQGWEPHSKNRSFTLARSLGPLKALYQLVTNKPPPAHSIDFAPSSSSNEGTLIAGYRDAVRLWDAPSEEMMDVLPQSSEKSFEAVSYSPQGDFVAGATINGDVFVWHARTKKLVRRFHAHGPNDQSESSADLSNDIHRLAFSHSPVGEYIATGAMNGKVSVWNWRKDLGEQESLTDTESVHVFRRTAIQENSPDVLKSTGDLLFRGDSPDSLVLIVGGTDGTLRFWSVPQGKLKQEIQVEKIDAMVLSPDENILALAQGENLTLRSLPAYERLAIGKAHTNTIQAVEFSPSGKWIATGSGDINPRERDDRVVLWKNPFHEAGESPSKRTTEAK